MKDWHNPHSIRYTKAQVKWLIPLLSLLRAGEYPPDPKETGYTGTDKPQFKSGAKFEIAAGIAGILDLRIQRAGWDGMLLELLYTNEPEDELFLIHHMAMAIGEDEARVTGRIKKALQYITGGTTKKPTYKQFRWHERAEDE